MRRFFLPPDALRNEFIQVSGAEARHIAVVLRLQPGQLVEFFDGCGAVYTTALDSVEKNLVTASIVKVRRENSRPVAPLTLAQCLLKGKKMDFLVQKATELGVHAFLPLHSRYCENLADRVRQQERWQRIMIEACKQSHRTTPMHIHPVVPLDKADFSLFRHRLAAWEEERYTALPSSYAEQPGDVCLLLGPEGGFHPDDLLVIHDHKFTTFSLGSKILRGETAALAAVAIVQYFSGALQPNPP
ncbi:RsmE family RNA methyltransferase [Desulfobulbus alkaliphilus]|uniref:RsmE family RNA methyltransferase n=1 Tax=Desulfobulbus alkaliphilus TaxID=869814 RepID=UPI001965ED02|nr:RsmE family RNA methyltransferase [Desulfobulbus alkaliphilus]MBM9536689.1 16S rRNA (uracil(1498)-N(3))-methyltransferase [Desulfobulbus alkaliphilus]